MGNYTEVEFRIKVDKEKFIESKLYKFINEYKEYLEDDSNNEYRMEKILSKESFEYYVSMEDSRFEDLAGRRTIITDEGDYLLIENLENDNDGPYELKNYNSTIENWAKELTKYVYEDSIWFKYRYQEFEMPTELNEIEEVKTDR